LERGQKRKRHSDKDKNKHDKKKDRKGPKRCKNGHRRNQDLAEFNVGESPFGQPSVATNTSQDIVIQDVSVLPSTATTNFVDLSGGFPQGRFTHLFVDGNNMFYLTDKLRQFTLRGKTKMSEKVLSSVARYFAELVRLNVEIVFDAASSIPRSADTSVDATPVVHLDNGSSFCISSARPTYQTSDAKFVAWARAHPTDAPNTLVITSDRALCAELQSLGVSTTKPGMWLTCVAQTAAGAPTENDWRAWLNAWIDKVLAEEASE